VQSELAYGVLRLSGGAIAGISVDRREAKEKIGSLGHGFGGELVDAPDIACRYFGLRAVDALDAGR
jgi:hypothetical protein